MKIKCLEKDTAYIEDDAGDVRSAYNFRDHVDLHQQTVPGGDGLPMIVPAGCGREFDVDADTIRWDINTARKENNIVVVEEHIEPQCPSCGTSADHLSRAVKSVPLVKYLAAKRDERLAAHFGARFDTGLPDEIKDALDVGRAQLVGDEILPYPVVSGGADAGYAHFTEGAIALGAATPKTIIGGKSHANFGMSLHYLSISFDGVSAAAVPVLVELLYCTWATNGPGTNSTSTTQRQEYGRVLAAGATSGKTWTTEPTVLTGMSKEMLQSPNSSLVIYDVPLGKEPDCALAEGFAVRCNAPAAVNVRATMKWRRC